MDERIKRLKEISEELFTIANSYVGDETGIEASLLHLTDGNILNVIKSIEGEKPIDEFEVVSAYKKWASQITLLKYL